MTTICVENERIKHRYFEYLKEALQRSEGTIDEARKCIHRFEQFTGCANFKTFNKQAAMDFKKNLRGTKSKQSGDALSLSTLEYIVRNVKDFFIWLRQEPGYRSRIKSADVDYFNLSENDIRAARSARRRKYPSVEQVVATLQEMPNNTEVEKRNRAMLAFLLLTGVRIDVLISLRMKHIDIDSWEVEQNPKEVPTKRRKAIYTFFFPVGEYALDVFCDYYEYMKNEKLFGPDDPLFPMTDINTLSPKGGSVLTIARKRWKTSQNASRLIKQAFAKNGLPDYPPHSIRHTLAAYGERLCENPAQWKAWSLNLGHTHTSTTFNAYASMDVDSQERQIRDFWEPKPKSNKDDLMKDLAKTLVEIKEKMDSDS